MSKLECGSLTVSFGCTACGMWSRKLKACRPTKMHLGFFRNRLLSDNMIAFRLAAGNFYLTYFLPNVVVTCTYFLKMTEHIIKWQFKKHFKGCSFPFLCNLLWEPGNSMKSCVSLPPSLHSQFEEVMGKLQVLESEERTPTDFWALVLEKTWGCLQKRVGQILGRSLQHT